MVENTKIEWATHTFNPWVGCQKVGKGCDFCYAEVANGGAHALKWGPKADRVRTKPRNWNQPAKWNAAAAAAGVRASVFCASLADVFDNHKSIDASWRADLAKLIIDTPNLDWMLLTKRIRNSDYMLRQMFPGGVPSNLWLGATIVNQEEANRDVQWVMEIGRELQISNTFLSMEPLLGPVDLTAIEIDGRVGLTDALAGRYYPHIEKASPNSPPSKLGKGFYRDMSKPVSWIIVGGETGAEARPINIDWVRSLRDQCAQTETPFLFKQWGNWFPYGEVDGNGAINSRTRGEKPGMWHEWSDGTPGFSVRMDKVEAGRFLDGRTHDGLPAPIPPAPVT